jgi:uncharacterized protein YndB with AHSA1/START domain
MRTVSATIQIGAPPMAVWAILTDLGRYPEWNPLFLEAAGDIIAGQRIRLRSKQPATGRPMTIKPKIIVAEPGVELRWASSLPVIIGGEHSFALSAVDGGTGWSRARASTACSFPSRARPSPAPRPPSRRSTRRSRSGQKPAEAGTRTRQGGTRGCGAAGVMSCGRPASHSL